MDAKSSRRAASGRGGASGGAVVPMWKPPRSGASNAGAGAARAAKGGGLGPPALRPRAVAFFLGRATVPWRPFLSLAPSAAAGGAGGAAAPAGAARGGERPPSDAATGVPKTKTGVSGDTGSGGVT